MAVGYIVAAVIIVAAALYAWYKFKNIPPQENMQPQGLDAFRVTYNQEGMPVPMHWGMVRLPGNLLWYGNLYTEEMREDVGGKGGGSESAVTGYKYYLDHWQAVCQGPAYVHSVYVDDKLWTDDGTIPPGSYDWVQSYYLNGNVWMPTMYYHYESTGRVFNWSTGQLSYTDPIVTAMQTQIGEYATCLNGIAFAWFDYFLCGENRTFLPTIHFVVERYTKCPLTHSNMQKGANPAAVIYDILKEVGVSAAEIDFSSFQAAADHWYDEGMAINIALSQQTTAREAIQNVFNYVDGVLYVNEDDKFVLKAFTDDESPVDSITTVEFKDFVFERPSWDEVYSDFRAKYTDETKDFSQRSLRVINSAVRNLTGYSRQMTLDLTAFRDVDIASKRLWQLARKQSYPASNIQFTVSMKYYRLNVGDVVEVTNSDYGMDSAQFRILHKDLEGIDKNEVKFTATQYLEGLFLDTYIPAGDPQWTNPDTFSYPAQYTEYFELPYNPVTGRDPAFLVLAQRSNNENGFVVMQSATGSDYYTAGAFTTWSMRCTLDVQYLSSTPEIDDEIGLILSPDYAEDPQFLNLDRADLFMIQQIAICGNEIMAFQYYQPYGSTQIRLTGIIRGVWNTPIETHNVNDKVWLTRINQNVLKNLLASEVYLKVLPFAGADLVPEDEVSATQVSMEYLSLQPWDVGNIQAVRSGNDITVTWFPSSQDKVGAGRLSPNEQNDEDPMKFDGDFYITDTRSEANSYIADTEKAWTQGSKLTTTVTVKARRDGYLSTGKTVYVDTADGTYWG